jgi:ATP-binding cassette subfamily B protein
MSREKTRKTGMARLLELAGTKKPLMAGAVVLSALASVVSFVPHLAIYMIVRDILGALPDLGTLNGGELIRTGWLAFAGVAGNILLYFGALVCSHLAAFGTLYDLKVNFASHLAKLPLGFHTVIGSGKLRKIMDENIEKVEEFIAHQLPDIVAAFVAPAVMIIILMAVDWRFGAAALLAVIVSFFVQMSMYGNEGSKVMMAKYQSSIEEMNNAAVEYVRGISVVKAFRQTVYSFRRLRDTIRAYTEMVIPYTLSWENSFSGFVALVNNIYLFILPVAIFAGKNTGDYPAFASTFLFYLLFTPAAASILMKVMYVNGNVMRIISGVEAMDAVLDEPELSRPLYPKSAEGYDVVFSNVTFSYGKGKDVQALSGVSFTAKQGEVTAIVGPSGGGKSTIAHLIPRFFDVKDGEITVGGADVRDMESGYLMDKVSFVFQDVFLFKQSVMDNIRLGNPNAPDARVKEAAKSAQCHDFIEKLPRGYQTVIGTRGVHLSGGERQRIAIARAIIKDAPVVVLDEATAFADPENERLIQKAFETLMSGKTVIMIAHRLSTVQNANKIIVVDGGRVIEQGTHSGLLSANGKYLAMWNLYNQTASWSIAKKEAGVNA